MEQIKHYSKTMVALHWSLALFILGALFMGAIILDEMESSNPQKLLLLKLHILVGFGILLLTLFRLFLRLTKPQPAPAKTTATWMDRSATAVHYLLYVFTILTVLAGVSLALTAGLPAVLIDQIGTLPADYENFIAHEVHEIFAQLLLLTIVLHVAAALYHQFILKDGLLSRMTFSKAK